MRTKRLLAAGVIAIGTATALAAPAFADEELDEQFLAALKDKGVPIESDEQALALAQATCDSLDKGAEPVAALRDIQTQTGWSDDDAMDFGSIAVYAYCKDELPESG
ncbi:MAG TPA: DUF732 domain-containing protein [Mycobacterium sp.]|nr:DUF732 domain-containing protein [Mycobacterium sp.]